MDKVYILQKDLPDSKKGDEYIWRNDVVGTGAYYKNGDKTQSYWLKGNVENNAEWFKVKVNLDIDNAITLLISEGYTVSKGSYGTLSVHHSAKDPLCATYTEVEMRDCFNESRLTHPMVGFKFDTFEDYLKSKQKYGL